ncbi:DUF947-domain-containing protein [Daedalea quercina L-15889]|uniref:rRNA biogenesis protein RRP36 n=1 Tax=Daedalea quercina L-15889 TaxID=1314783 RepID=A0A165T2Q1_9APHY|nr:DUF947-domain-containing protein [Daedalea quercina L-15889]
MPRRPRPAFRRPPANSGRQGFDKRHAAGNAKSRGAPIVQQYNEQSGTSSSASGSEEEDSTSVEYGSQNEMSREEADELDLDRGRVAQWVDDEELEDAPGAESDPESGASEEEAEQSTHGAENALASMSFGTLRTAQKELARASALDRSDEGADSSEDESEVEEVSSRYDGKGKEREMEKPSKPKKDIPKRPHKHAPTEVSSKKPVPRKKLAVEGEKVVPRDPRFLPMTGELSTKRFRSQYAFLAEMHNQEMQTLRENLKRARKLLVNSPRHLREEREEEVQRLERAYKRAESMVNKDRREQIEQEALERVSKEEKEKRKAGKGAWYMKDSDKKELLLRAKYEALATSGGRGAVRKAIDKRQKKANQKEKKKRPFAPGPGKRPAATQGDDNRRNGKRRRVG